MIYTDGTIAIKAGSPIVTGTGTQWKKNIHGVAPGQMVSIENGVNPVNMMIRAVNSDTELVLSFNAPVTLSGAKYSITTTVPDTISDAARTMSANQGYIVYFLQAMQQWMTDTGQVEIELPNGQKVTLESIKALNEAIGKIPKVVQASGESETAVMSQKATGAAIAGIKIPEVKDATTGQKGVVMLASSVGTSTTKVPHEKAVSEALGKKSNSTDVATEFDKKLEKTAKTFTATDGLTWWTGLFDKLNGGGCRFFRNSSVMTSANPFPVYSTGVYAEAGDTRGVIGIPYSTDPIVVAGRAGSDGVVTSRTLWDNLNSKPDANGWLKVSSPIIEIYPSGSFKTNDESEGTEVNRTDTGQYHITGILGYNSDGAWGVNGGISVPKDNNGLELVYVADRVMEDGGIIIETCHRQHTHLPDKFQNWRLKEVTSEGERIFYQDGESCDLPESTRLDVRVEMPQGSVWNVKQCELAEQMECEQAEREEQEDAEQAEDSEE